MSTTQTFNQSFQHQPKTDSCTCPIHRNRDRDPFTAPLGLDFAEDVHVKPISRDKATAIYESHHGYMSGDLHNANFVHHGLYYQDLLGAITYRFPFFSRKRLHFNEQGDIMQEPVTDSDIENLPEHLQARARDLLGGVAPGDISEKKVIRGDRFAEANRICIGERMPNLASCSLAKSQEAFIQSADCPETVDYLITYVRADFPGSMIQALRGKGWTCIGWSEPTEAGNRESKEIRDSYKWVFCCPVETALEQATLTDWGPS
jgi:hypothetical protein